MSQVQIDNVLNAQPPFTPQGKTFSVYEFTCDGYIDGNYAGNFIVKTLSGKAATHVRPGFQFNSEIDNFGGAVKHKIPKWMYQQGQPLSQPFGGGGAPQGQPPQGTGQPSQGMPPQGGTSAPSYNPPPAPPQGETYDSVVQKHRVCMATACDLYPDMPNDVQAAIAATLFIECNRKGIIPTDATPAQNDASFPPQGQPAQGNMNANMQNTMLDKINQLLAGANLMGRVESAKGMNMINDEALTQLFINSQGNDNAFIMKVNSELTNMGVQ